MAMLSEPRQKKRYNLVPRGKALYEADDNRFGKKIMEKMGWSKEKGLGAREDGSKEFVRVRYKNDSNGLGFEDRDDQWTQHEEQFNGLLKSLNNSGNNSDADDINDTSMATVGFGFKSGKQQSDSIKDKISGESLEEKSKMSKARVHYKKFTRGKDLTKCSEKDLANIFGKKVSSDAQMPTLAYGVNLSVGKTEFDANNEDSSNRYDINTINTNVSVDDYFKSKLKKRNKVEKYDEKPEYSETPEIDNCKKKKKKRKIDDNDENPDEVDEPKTGNENIPQEAATLKRKRKKKDNEEESSTASKKKKTSESMETEINSEEEKIMLPSQLDLPNDDSSEMIKSKKKKKSKKSLSEPFAEKTNESLIYSNNTYNKYAEIESVEVTKKPKKKSKLNEVEVNATAVTAIDNCSDIDFSQAIKAEKKKKSKKSLLDPLENTNLIETPDNSEVKLKKRKNKLIDQELEDSNTNVADSNEDADQTSSSWTTVAKKKKSKSNKESQPESIEQSGDAEQIEPTEQTEQTEPTEQTEQTEPTEQPTQKNEAEPDNPKVAHEIFEYEKGTSTLYISSYCAEKFRHIDVGKFTGASIGDVVGYSLDDDINLKIIKCSNDERKIADLWNTENTHKLHPSFKYFLKVQAARKANKPLPKFNCKSNKRRTVFQKI